MISFRGPPADHQADTAEPIDDASELSPHPTRAARAYADICPDGHSASVVVEPRHMMFRYANFSGRALLRQRYPARLSRGVVEIASERGALLLREAMRTVRQNFKPMMIVCDGDQGAFSIRISFWSPGQETGSPSGVAILEFRVGAFELSQADLWAIGMGFGLTEAETAVLGYLTRGFTLSQIARHRRVELETVRSQCKSVLGKMGCHRQVDLVRLMISLCAGAAFRQARED